MYTARVDGMIQMLNEVWNGLVDEIKVVKGRYVELETAVTTTNDHLNDGLSAVLDQVDKLEAKYRSLRNLYDNVRTIINAQERKISDLDNKVNFYSQDLVKLKGKKYKKIEDCFEVLEQCILGQDKAWHGSPKSENPRDFYRQVSADRVMAGRFLRMMPQRIHARIKADHVHPLLPVAT